MTSKISAKQAVLFTAINYIGVAIGVISTVLIYPLDKELLGIVRYVDAFAQLLFPIMVLGSTNALINFYPSLSQKLQEKLFSFSLLSIVKMAVLVAIVIALSSFYLDGEKFKYLLIAFPLGLFMAYVELYKRQATNLQKLSVPTFYEKIIPKLALPLVFILVLYGAVSTDSALGLYVVAYGVIMVLVGRYVFKHYRHKLFNSYEDLFEQLPKKNYYAYSLYSFAGSFGAFFAFRVDSLMIPEFISFDANGTYNIAVTLASTLAIPATGVFALYAPVIARLIKENAWGELNIKYKNVCKYLFFIGAFLFSCIMVGIEPLFLILPTYENLAPSLPVIYILGINVVINMSTGFNTEIISYSKYYRFNLIAILSLMVLNIVLNWYLLSQTDLGILGVAYATLISLTLFNLAKTLYIYKKMGLWPFDKSFVKMVAFFVVVVLLVFEIPLTNYSWFDLLYKVFLVVVIHLIALYKFQWVPEITDYLNKLKTKIVG
ncbi:MATE family efflux transporter [Myroides guanonis]|uniref:Membrane protein involved in the export of O-antigen and teichoic acid n=1 Tax=Myroides guanonis TaxID=1150112 RepID=A0A1I3Q2I3_9FLAO|nr:polysaccharide biosynthesis C-terminal domain-containing protein [Myroides guanonis]SFJ27661.1 Membrane protein involved in the export of O-antigen and teichoic acid [Myroides guanonis]